MIPLKQTLGAKAARLYKCGAQLRREAKRIYLRRENESRGRSARRKEYCDFAGKSHQLSFNPRGIFGQVRKKRRGPSMKELHKFSPST